MFKLIGFYICVSIRKPAFNILNFECFTLPSESIYNLIVRIKNVKLLFLNSKITMITKLDKENKNQANFKLINPHHVEVLY